ALPGQHDRGMSGVRQRTDAAQAPECVVRDLAALGRTQRLSLVDGALLDTDLPDLEGRTVPGWAAEEAQLLLVVVQAFQSHRARPDAEQLLLPMDLSGSRLVLPGGEEREVLAFQDALHAPPGARTGTDIRLWFEISLDLASAEV